MARETHWVPLDTLLCLGVDADDVIGRRIVGPFVRFSARWVTGPDGEPEEIEELLPGAYIVEPASTVTTRIVDCERTRDGGYAWRAAAVDGNVRLLASDIYRASGRWRVEASDDEVARINGDPMPAPDADLVARIRAFVGGIRDEAATPDAERVADNVLDFIDRITRG